MSQQDPPVSHVDIYHKLGTLEGKMDALIARTTEYRSDLQTAFDRITIIENKQAWIMGGAAVISIIVPMLMHVISGSFDVEINPEQNNSAAVVRNN